jgi:hypothetical protein
VGWAGAEAGSQAAKGIEAGADECIEAHTVVPRLVLCPLQGGEQAGGSWDGLGHEPQLPQNAAPLLGTDTMEATKVGEDVVQGLLAVRR